MPGVEIRIAPEDGEILVKGPNVFREYWRNPEATAETLVDGWLHTGDIGELDDDGFLKITGRKKDIIITAGGKNLTPSNLENDLKQSRFISQAVMYGDRRPFPVVLVTLGPRGDRAVGQGAGPARRPRPSWPSTTRCARSSRPSSTGPTPTTPRSSRSRSSPSSTTTCRIDSGELTPTLKVKRNVIYDRYGDLFDQLYAR